MKILVTGSAGFIGYHLTNALIREGHEVIGLDSINNYYDIQLKFDRLNELGIEKEDISSGRIKIFEEQIESFYENPIFGIGVGNGKYKRQEGIKGVTAASHNEIGRLIEEHGLIGILSLILLILIPMILFFSVNNYNKAYILFFGLIWFLTINHSAMRIALPSLMYGLALLKIQDDE